MTGNDADRSAGLWLLSFSATTGAVLCGRVGWLPALLGGGLAALAYRFRLGRGRAPAAIWVVQTLWLAVPLRVAANGAAALFPAGGQSLYVPAVALGLGWLLCRHARGGVLACCAVAGFFVLGALGAVSLCAIPDLRLRWLYPAFSWGEVLIALAAGSGGMLLAEAIPAIRPGPGWRLAAALAPAAISALAVGCLSRPLAARQASAFYTLSRAVSLFGVAERFEALIAACLTLGICSACALLLRAACGGKTVRALLAAGALVLTRLPVPEVAAAAGTVFFWGVLPGIFAAKHEKPHSEKKSKKDEKSS